MQPSVIYLDGFDELFIDRISGIFGNNMISMRAASKVLWTFSSSFFSFFLVDKNVGKGRES
jgi:hypothetical protein